LSRHLGWVAPLQPDIALALACAVVIPAGLVAGTIFFVLVERPCMDPAWPERARNRLHGTVRPVAQSDALVVIPDIEEVPVPR
jgi:peptidoglycan/LPS O-acetylase OafA/YrhL